MTDIDALILLLILLLVASMLGALVLVWLGRAAGFIARNAAGPMFERVTIVALLLIGVSAWML